MLRSYLLACLYNKCLGVSEEVKRKEERVDDEEEEKEVDPSLVGSLDNVYTEETEAQMMKEDDPFKKVQPVVDKDHASSTYEIEETVNALLVYSSDSNSHSPLQEDEDNDLSSLSSQNLPTGDSSVPVDLLSSPTDNSNTVTDVPLIPTTSQELLPDVIGTSSSGSQSTEVTSSSDHVPPDVAPHGNLPPDLAAESQHPVDLLNSNDRGRQDPMDLTEGTFHGNTPDVTQQ